MGQQRIEELRRTGLGLRRIGHAHFGREGVGVEPVQQLCAPGADDVELRAVHMAVDEAGQDQLALVVDGAPVGTGRVGLRADDAPVFDEQPMVGPKAHGRAVAIGTRRRPP